jgi:hypothetical protein
MATTKLSKVHFNKSKSTIDFATENYLLDFLKILKAESHLPINQVLIMLFNNEADTVSCSRDDTNYSFFARLKGNVISVIVKKLGEETIEFDIPRNKLDKIKPLPHL